MPHADQVEDRLIDLVPGMAVTGRDQDWLAASDRVSVLAAAAAQAGAFAGEVCVTKQGRMRGRCLVAIFVAIFGTSFVAKQTGVPPALASDRTFVQSAHDDQGPYYRFKLKLIYKGEKQDFDIIVGCKVPYDMYDSIYVGVVPTIFGRRMGDGKGLVIRVPRACDGQSLTGVGEDVSQYPQK